MILSPQKSLLSLATAAVAAAALAGTASAAPSIKVHAIFGGTGVHVGQVLAVQAPHGAKPTQVCWEPAPIGRPACSDSENGAPSQTGATRLTVRLADGTTLHKTLRVAPGYARRGGHGGSDAAAGHVTTCPSLTLWGNVPSRHSSVRHPSDKVTTLKPGAQVAQYNRIGGYVFYWEYATNKAGFGKAGCVHNGLGA